MGAGDGEDPFGLADYFVVNLPGTRADAGALGHDLAYRVSAFDDIEAAYFEGVGAHYVALGSILGGGTPPADRDWARKAMRMPAGFSGGANVTIAHPDTGWAAHPELDAAALDLADQWSTLDDRPDARDPLDFLLFNGHGTGTGSQMVSSAAGQINGVAPDAKLLPIRCARSVVLVLDTELAEAVWYAINHQAHVLSISLGGFPVPHLESVINHAVEVRNMIVCASAGNVTPFVVYPAAYRNCIAVAGTTPTDRPWRFSSYGPQIAVSAPSHLVWVADFDGQRQPVAAAPGSGTSFATPQVAAAAALWLSLHGRAQLLQRYAGAAPLQAVFRRLLAQTARRPGPFAAPGGTGDVSEGATYTWNQQRYGPGIIDISSLLAAALPPKAAFSKRPPRPPSSWFDVLDHLFPTLHRDDVLWRLTRVLNLDPVDGEKRIEQFGPELTQALIDDPGAREAFLSLVGPPERESGRSSAASLSSAPESEPLFESMSATLRTAIAGSLVAGAQRHG